MTLFLKVLVFGYTKIVKLPMKKCSRCLSGARLVLPGYEMDNKKLLLYYRAYIFYLKSMACQICSTDKKVMNFPKMSSGS